MKKWIKDWWFSILMWLSAVLVAAYSLWAISNDDELLILGACMCAYLITSLLLITIGCANAPRKGKKDETTDKEKQK